MLQHTVGVPPPGYENKQSMPARRPCISRGVVLGMIGLAAACAARADYYQCHDEFGGTYKVRQQIENQHNSFFSQCELVTEASEPVVEESTAGYSDPSPQSMVIVLPARTKNATRAPRRPTRPDPATERLIHQVADEYKLDPHLLKAIVHVESGFNTKAVSPKGALGLMQVMPTTGKRYGVARPALLLEDPAENLRAGARYLRDLARKFQNRVDLVLAAYNAGEGSVMRNDYRVPPFPETQSYVVSVQQAYRTYRFSRQ